jgi:hypothetical protein
VKRVYGAAQSLAHARGREPDPSCHEPDKADNRSAFNGLAQAIIQTTREAGTITVTARAEGLAAATATLTSARP